MKKSRRSYVAARMSKPITMVFRFVVGMRGWRPVSVMWIVV
jgi:hypothetical protein